MKKTLRNLLAIYWKTRLGKIHNKERREWRMAYNKLRDWEEWVLLKERKIHCNDREYMAIVSQSSMVFRSVRYAVAIAELRSRTSAWAFIFPGVCVGVLIGLMLP